MENINDELKVFRGKDFILGKHMVLKMPTLDEICDYGEREYFSMIYNLTATPQSLKGQLWQKGIDYTTLTPYELFYKMMYGMYPLNKTSIIFGDLDFTKFIPCSYKETGDVSLVQVIDGDCIVFDEMTYNIIIDYLCGSHLIKRDLSIPGNEGTKIALIEDALEELKINEGKEYHSSLKNMISTLVNMEGFKYDYSSIWNMKINVFMDSVKRISKIKNADLLLQSGYSGFGVDLNKIKNKDVLDWFGTI